MIKAISIIEHGRSKRVIPTLLLEKTERFSEFDCKNPFVMRTSFGKQLIVVDLYNRYFPLELKTIILDSGIYLAVYNFALFIQPHGLFLTSQERVLCRKFDDTPGTMFVGKCQRFFNEDGDLFTLEDSTPVTAPLN